MTEPFVIWNGDTLTDVESLENLLACNTNAILTSYVDADDKEAMHVHRYKGKVNAITKDTGSTEEAFGIYLIDSYADVADACTNMVKRTLVDYYYESALNFAIHKNGVEFETVNGKGIEIDTIEDLEEANETW